MLVLIAATFFIVSLYKFGMSHPNVTPQQKIFSTLNILKEIFH